MDLITDAKVLCVVSEMFYALLLGGHNWIIVGPWIVRNSVVIVWELDVQFVVVRRPDSSYFILLFIYLYIISLLSQGFSVNYSGGTGPNYTNLFRLSGKPLLIGMIFDIVIQLRSFLIWNLLSLWARYWLWTQDNSKG